jgi:hypothetical protein
MPTDPVWTTVVANSLPGYRAYFRDIADGTIKPSRNPSLILTQHLVSGVGAVTDSRVTLAYMAGDGTVYTRQEAWDQFPSFVGFYPVDTPSSSIALELHARGESR